MRANVDYRAWVSVGATCSTTGQDRAVQPSAAWANCNPPVSAMGDCVVMFPDKTSIGGLQERPHFISSNHPISTVVVGDPASAKLRRDRRKASTQLPRAPLGGAPQQFHAPLEAHAVRLVIQCTPWLPHRRASHPWQAEGNSSLPSLFPAPCLAHHLASPHHPVRRRDSCRLATPGASLGGGRHAVAQ